MAGPDELVQVNASGPADERLNMVFLGDGYIESELPCSPRCGTHIGIYVQ